MSLFRPTSLAFVSSLIATLLLSTQNTHGQIPLPNWLDSFELVPGPYLADGQQVTFLPAGTWGRPCDIPDLTETRLDGDLIHLYVLLPELTDVCPDVATPWSLSQLSGSLSSGDYAVAASLFRYDPLNPANRQQLEPASLVANFTVVPEPSFSGNLLMLSAAILIMGWPRRQSCGQTQKKA